jgi:proline iminopeptidase
MPAADTAVLPSPLSITDEGRVPVPGGQVWFRIVGAPAKTPIILVHGGPGGTHDYFEPLLALAEDRPVLVYDQLGSGRSDRPDDPSLWRVPRFVEELEAVRARAGWSKVILLGHSFGGVIAAEYARHHPAHVHAIVLVSPFYSVSRWDRDVRALIATLSPAAQAAIARHEASGTFEHPDYRAAVTEFQRRYLCRLDPPPESMKRTEEGVSRSVYQTLWGPSDFFVTGRLTNWERGAQIATLPQPMLITCGRSDQCTPESTGHLAKLNPLASFAVFDDCAHVTFLENPGAFLRVVGEFLRSYDVPRS